MLYLVIEFDLSLHGCQNLIGHHFLKEKNYTNNKLYSVIQETLSGKL